MKHKLKSQHKQNLDVPKITQAAKQPSQTIVSCEVKGEPTLPEKTMLRGRISGCLAVTPQKPNTRHVMPGS